jgi:hypothetical protein
MTAVRIATPARDSYHRWSAGDDERLRLGYRRGDPIDAIAAAMNVTTSAVSNRAKKLGQGHRRAGRSLEQRFLDYVSHEPNSGCWLWEGSCDRKGYGQLRTGKTSKLATHVSLELNGRKVPKGMQACHHCDVPGCVNPEHLFVGSPLQNTADMMAKGRNSPPPKAKPGQGVKAICLRGHVRAITSSGRRVCLECGRLKKATRRAGFVAAGLRCDGVPRNSKIKLSEADIPVIRRRLAAGETPTSIASGYGVTPTSIGHIRHGKTWRYVE